MDHSIQGYLSRRSTEELKAILKYFSEEENCRNYEHTVLEIRDALAQRLESEADDSLLTDYGTDCHPAIPTA